MAELNDWVAPPKAADVDDWIAPPSSGYPAHGPAADVRAAYGAVSPYIPEYLKESGRSLYEGARQTAQNFSRDLDTPTLEGGSGAAVTALGAPIRAMTAGQAGFGTAIDAVMNPLTLNQWGDRAERFYDPVEQRFNQNNEGIVSPVKGLMEGSLSLPYGIAGTGAFRPGEAQGPPTNAVFDHYLEEARKTGQAVDAKLRGNAAYSDAANAATESPSTRQTFALSGQSDLADAIKQNRISPDIGSYIAEALPDNAEMQKRALWELDDRKVTDPAIARRIIDSLKRVAETKNFRVYDQDYNLLGHFDTEEEARAAALEQAKRSGKAGIVEDAEHLRESGTVLNDKGKFIDWSNWRDTPAADVTRFNMERRGEIPPPSAGTGIEPPSVRAKYEADLADWHAAKSEPTRQIYAQPAYGDADLVHRLHGDVAYGDPNIITRMLQSPDEETRGIGAALRDNAPDFAKLQFGVEDGNIHPAWAPTGLSEAAHLIADLRERGIAPSDYVAQQGAKIPQHVAEWVKLLYDSALLDPDAFPAEHNHQRTDWTLKTYLREPLGEPGTSVIPSSPQEGFRAGVDALWGRKDWLRAEERNAQTPGSRLISGISNRIESRPAFEADPEWLKQATAHDPSERSYAGQALDSLQPYDLDPHAHDATVQVMRQFEDKLPPGVKIGVLNRVEPTSDPNVIKGLVTDAPDFTNYVRPDFITQGAAMWDPGTSSVILSRYGTAGFKSIGDFSHGVQAEAIHEIGHAVSALHLSPSERTALISDASWLGVLNVPFNLYTGLRYGEIRSTNSLSLRRVYGDHYKDRPADIRGQLMDEEAIAVLVELYHNGVVDPKDLSPTTHEILDKIVKGGFSK
jgi:hypothetical protein